jgi:RimJ/RimL family protein N-acetyltransferase
MQMLPTTSIPDLKTSLSDGQITLRLTEERDIPEILVAHDDDSQLHITRGLRRPPSGADLGRAREEAPRRRALGLDEELTIVAGPSPDGEFLGQVIVHRIDWQDRRAELGVWLKPQARGRQVGRRALALTAGWLFGTWRMARLELLTDPGNAAVIACAQAAGFELEGVLRSHSKVGEERYDDSVLALLAPDLR